MSRPDHRRRSPAGSSAAPPPASCCTSGTRSCPENAPSRTRPRGGGTGGVQYFPTPNPPWQLPVWWHPPAFACPGFVASLLHVALPSFASLLASLQHGYSRHSSPDLRQGCCQRRRLGWRPTPQPAGKRRRRGACFEDAFIGNAGLGSALPKCGLFTPTVSPHKTLLQNPSTQQQIERQTEYYYYYFK